MARSKSSQRWLREHFDDEYVQRARKEGYRSRAVYKLIEIQEKLFKNGGFTTRGTNAEKGTGLGLSICKQMVELNYGKIWVESEPNLGSKFFVELPKSKPSA